MSISTTALPKRIVKHRFWFIGAWFGGVLVPLVIWGGWAAGACHEGGMGWDAPILHFIHRAATTERDGLVAWLTIAGG